MYIYVCVYVCVYVHAYLYIYIYMLNYYYAYEAGIGEIDSKKNTNCSALIEP